MAKKSLLLQRKEFLMLIERKSIGRGGKHEKGFYL